MSERVGRARIDGVIVNGGEPLPVYHEAARKRLAQLTVDQLILQQSGAFNGFLENPLSNLPSSWVAQQIERDEANGVFDVVDEEAYKVRMQGRIFERLAYATLSAWQPDNRAVLSSADTLDYFGAIFPRHKKIKTSSGNWTINGVYVPDGLIVRMNEDIRPQILTAIEATTNIVEKIKDGQISGDLLKSTMRHSMMDGAQLALVFPTQEIPIDTLDQLGEEVCYMFPFNLGDFGIIADEITDRVLEIREPASPQDVLDRRLYQNLHLERGALGPDPLPWVIYADTGATETTNPHIDNY